MAHSRTTSSASAHAGSIARAFAGQRVALLRYTTHLLNGDATRAEFVVQSALEELVALPPDDLAADEAEACFGACHRQVHAVSRPEDRTKLFVEPPAGPAQTGSDDYTALLRAIDRLTPKQQEVVRLKFQNGFSHAAIARIVDLPRDKVSALMHTAVAHLRADQPGRTQISDARITARALNEQTDPERDAFASLARENPEIEPQVSEIRIFAAQIEEALAIESGARAPRRTASSQQRKIRWLRFPALWFVMGGSVAAALSLFFFLRSPRPQANGNGRFAGDFSLKPASWQDSAPAETEKVRTVGPQNSSGSRPQSENSVKEPAGFFPTAPASHPSHSFTRSPDEGPTTGETLKGDALAPGTPDVAAAVGGPGQLDAAANLDTPKARLEKKPADGKFSEMKSPNADLAPSEDSPVYRLVPAVDPRGETVRRVPLAHKGPGALGGADFRAPSEKAVSTLPSDTDTASVAGLLNVLGAGEKPASSTIHVEQILNYFPTSDPGPKADAAFSASIESAEAPWNSTHRLVRIGLKGRETPPSSRPGANLVFLLDVSASMDLPTRLPLVQEALRLLLQRLRPDDRVAIVTYAGESQLLLPSTPVSESPRIRHVLAALHPGGQTNGGAGIQLAYTIAHAGFIEGGANRVILCTDGDFNVGLTDAEALSALAAEQAKAHISLSVFGFGRGYRIDARLEALAAQGQGRSGYVTTQREAERALADEVEGLFAPIARDVKLEVAFNPTKVADFRLIGYEHEDKPTADETSRPIVAPVIGSGHMLTALYEIIPTGRSTLANSPRDPWLIFKVDYQDPVGPARHVLDFPLEKSGGHFSEASSQFKFSAAVAAFGMILKNAPEKGTSTLSNVADWAEAGRGDDAGGYRNEFIELVRAAQKLEP